MPATRTRALRTLVAFVLGLSVLTACQATTPAAPAKADRDTLTVAVTADGAANTFNPRRATPFPARRLMSELYSSLVEKNYYDPSKPFGLGPGLAERWDISPDGTTYTFYLRKGVQFTDGTPFDAEAVAFNLQVLVDKAAPGYDQASATAVSKYTALFKEWRVVDPSTFRLVLKAPFGGLLDELSSPQQMGMISPAAIKQNGMAGIEKNPVGTGPYKLDSYKPGEVIVLTRNDAYFRGPATFKKLVMRIITDPVARAVALESRQADIAEDVNIGYQDLWKSRSDLEVRVTPNPATYICRLDFKNGPTANFEFRKALSLAVNREQINQLVFKGAAALPSSYFSPGTPAHSPKDPTMTYDPQAAKAAIEKLGLKGTKLIYEVTETLGNTAVWEVLNRNLSAVGISPVQRSVDLATWLANLQRGLSVEPNGALRADALNMLCSASGTDVMSTLATTAGPETAPNVNRGGNAGYYDNAKVKAAFAAAASSRTADEYVAAMRKVNEEIVADFGILYILSNLNIHGMSRTVEWQPTPSQAHTYYSAKPK